MPDINFRGIIPAIAVPFKADYSINEPELRRFAKWLGAQEGVTQSHGIVP